MPTRSLEFWARRAARSLPSWLAPQSEGFYNAHYNGSSKKGRTSEPPRIAGYYGMRVIRPEETFNVFFFRGTFIPRVQDFQMGNSWSLLRGSSMNRVTDVGH